MAADFEEKKKPQMWTTHKMRKTSGYFRRKLSSVQSHYANHSASSSAIPPRLPPVPLLPQSRCLSVESTTTQPVEAEDTRAKIQKGFDTGKGDVESLEDQNSYIAALPTAQLTKGVGRDTRFNQGSVEDPTLIEREKHSLTNLRPSSGNLPPSDPSPSRKGIEASRSISPSSSFSSPSSSAPPISNPASHPASLTAPATYPPTHPSNDELDLRSPNPSPEFAAEPPATNQTEITLTSRGLPNLDSEADQHSQNQMSCASKHSEVSSPQSGLMKNQQPSASDKADLRLASGSTKDARMSGSEGSKKGTLTEASTTTLPITHSGNASSLTLGSPHSAINQRSSHKPQARTSQIFNSMPTILASFRKQSLSDVPGSVLDSSSPTSYSEHSPHPYSASLAARNTFPTNNQRIQHAPESSIDNSESIQAQASTSTDHSNHLPRSYSHPFTEAGMAEEEKLRLSLERWQLDLEGVLSSGSSLRFSPHLSQTSLPPPAPSLNRSPLPYHPYQRSSSQSTISSFFSTSSDVGQFILRNRQQNNAEESLCSSPADNQPLARRPGHLAGGNNYGHPFNPSDRSPSVHGQNNSLNHLSASVPSLVNPERMAIRSLSPPSDFVYPLLPSSSGSKSSASQEPSRRLTAMSSSTHSAPITSSSSLPVAHRPTLGLPNSACPCSPPHLVWSHSLPLSSKNITAPANLSGGRRARSRTEDSSGSSLKTLNNYSPKFVNYAPPTLLSHPFRAPHLPVSSTHSESSSRRPSPSPQTSFAPLAEQDCDDIDSRLLSTPSIRLVSSSNSTRGYNQDSIQPRSSNLNTRSLSNINSSSSVPQRATGTLPSSSSSICSASTRSGPSPISRFNQINLNSSSRSSSPKSQNSPLSGASSGVGKNPDDFSAPTGMALGLNLAAHTEPNKGNVSEGKQRESESDRDTEDSEDICFDDEGSQPLGSSYSMYCTAGRRESISSLTGSGRGISISSRASSIKTRNSNRSTPEPNSQNLKPIPIRFNYLPDSSESLMNPSLSLEENAMRLAELFWNEDDRLVKKEKLMEWLGGIESHSSQSLIRLKSVTLKEYMNKFDLKGLRVDLAFRTLCAKLYIKGETQQVDRILAEFSQRFWEQNRSNLYFNADMVHALSYSILLLNTDLHVVDSSTRMSRSQFIRNTLEAIYAQLPSSPDNCGLNSSTEPEDLFGKTKGMELINIPLEDQKEQSSGGVRASFDPGSRRRRSSLVDWSIRSNAPNTRTSLDRWKEVLGRQNDTGHSSSYRSSSTATGSIENELNSQTNSESTKEAPFSRSMLSTSRIPGLGSSTPNSNSDRDCLPMTVKGLKSSEKFNKATSSSASVNTTVSQPQDHIASFQMVERFSKGQFDKEIDSLLKEIYLSIKSQPISNSAIPDSPSPSGAPSSSVVQRVSSRRSPHSAYASDRSGSGGGGGSSKRASLKGLLFADTSNGGSRSISPTPSMGSAGQSACSMTSGGQGYGSTSGSHNLTSLNTPSIGFASNLSQSIIRELKEEESDESKEETDQLTGDYEELALLGPPWAKEGILQRKQYWDSKGKRHKDKSWTQVFVVIAKGSLKMFKFGESGSASGKSGDANQASGTNSQRSGNQAGVGGGNWLPNAQLLGELGLSHALSSALPSGYNKDRPYAFVMTLSNGASYFFQVGTEELVDEWVSTCNYWSARLSKEPLTGGVSNMEYGWNQISELDMAISSAGRGSGKGLVKDGSISPTKDGSQTDPQDHEEIMSIMSGNSGHSQKSRRLKNRLFNGGASKNHHYHPHPHPQHYNYLPPLPAVSAPIFPSAVRPSSPNPLRSEESSVESPQATNGEMKGGTDFALSSLHHDPSGVPATPTSIPNLTLTFSGQLKSINLNKITINEWNPPVPPLATSRLSEVQQLESLKKHSQFLSLELERHNQLRRPMIDLLRSRPQNLQKARSNWEKKSQYLLTEIIKYSTYIDMLEESKRLRQKIYEERKANNHERYELQKK